MPGSSQQSVTSSKCSAQVGRNGAMTLKITVNDVPHEVDCPADMPLLWVLRDILGLTGTKFGCGDALCGACTVQIDGVAISSCVTPIGSASGRSIKTIEGIGRTLVGKRVQAAWIKLDVPQCGHCQSGQIVAACALLSQRPSPTEEEIDSAMARIVCRCGMHTRIRAAIQAAAKD